MKVMLNKLTVSIVCTFKTVLTNGVSAKYQFNHPRQYRSVSETSSKKQSYFGDHDQRNSRILAIVILKV